MARHVARLGLALALSALVHGCRADDLWGLVVEPNPAVVYSIPTNQPVVALTIDDGPHAESTPRILEVLHRHRATATFFLIADHVFGNEGIVSAISASGHEIGNHGAHDAAAIDLGAEHFEHDLVQSDLILSRFGAPRWFRPGSGWYDDWMLEILARHGYTAALGTVYPMDAQLPWTNLARRFILWKIRPGAVIILHDGGDRGSRTAELLDSLLPDLERRGFRVTGLSELQSLSQTEEGKTP
ncbi:MAG: polysaccharide deacetylase family protein [Deltaproteobacteria bacterium]|nr:polysaccharide deacetylase family protein [Deltaproteobacteria bacterium]